jgi:hypothetical protein
MASSTVTIERELTRDGDVSASTAVQRRRGLRLPSISAVFGACFALFAGVIQLRPLQDNSFLWHLKTGHWILDHGIPRSDLFSFTAPDAPWVVQSWLAEVAYAVVDDLSGAFGLRVFRALVSALIAYLVFRLAARLTGERARAAMLTTAALAASLTLWSERPLLLGVLAMVIVLWIVEVPDCLAGRRAAFTLPLLMWTWANVHGTFALGFAYLAAHFVGRRLDGARPWEGRDRQLLIGSAAALAACVVNPLGLSLLTFPIHLLRRGEVLNQILEWKSPDFHSFIGVLFGIWILIFVFVVAGARRRPNRRDLLVSVAFLLLGLWALRNVALAPFVGLVVVARLLAVHEKRPDRATPFNLAVIALFVVLGLSSVSQAAAENDFNFSTYPVEAMKVVEEQGRLGERLLTTDAWSAFVIHQYWPAQHIFIDDRYDMFPVELADEYFKLARGADEWQSILDRHRIDVVMWPVEKPLTRVLDLAPGWQSVFKDKQAGVWVRTAPSRDERAPYMSKEEIVER